MPSDNPHRVNRMRDAQQATLHQATALERIADALEYFVEKDKAMMAPAAPPDHDPPESTHVGSDEPPEEAAPPEEEHHDGEE